MSLHFAGLKSWRAGPFRGTSLVALRSRGRRLGGLVSCTEQALPRVEGRGAISAGWPFSRGEPCRVSKAGAQSWRLIPFSGRALPRIEGRGAILAAGLFMGRALPHIESRGAILSGWPLHRTRLAACRSSRMQPLPLALFQRRGFTSGVFSSRIQSARCFSFY